MSRRPPPSPGPTPVTIQPALLTADLDRLLRFGIAREWVAAFGGRVLEPPNDVPWERRVAHVQDPDRNAVDLTQPARWPGPAWQREAVPVTA